MSILLRIFSFLILGTLFCCGTTKINLSSYEGKSITFGNGGGVSGIEYSKVLLDNGKLFSEENMGTSHTYLKRIRQEDADQLFLSADILQLENIELNSPGNTYKFIEFKSANSENRIVWSANNASNELQILYRILTNKAQ